MATSWEVFKDIAEPIVLVLAIGFSVFRRRRNEDGEREWQEPSARRFVLYLVGAVICGCIAFFSARYMQDHPGDYANYLMIVGALCGGLFGAGLLLGALIEGFRFVFAGRGR